MLRAVPCAANAVSDTHGIYLICPDRTIFRRRSLVFFSGDSATAPSRDAGGWLYGQAQRRLIGPVYMVGKDVMVLMTNVPISTAISSQF